MRLRAFSSADPMRLIEVSATARRFPDGPIHQALSRYLRESAIMLPSLGRRVNAEPEETQDRFEDHHAATSSTATNAIGGRMLGAANSSRIRQSPAPSTRKPRTYSLPRSATAALRATRA